MTDFSVRKLPVSILTDVKKEHRDIIDQLKLKRRYYMQVQDFFSLASKLRHRVHGEGRRRRLWPVHKYPGT